jgi:Zn-dependent metalloprotease
MWMVILLPIAGPVFAQEQESDTLELRKDNRGNLTYLQFKPDQKKVRKAIDDKQIMNKVLFMKNGIDEFRLIQDNKDVEGNSHRKYQQYYRGIKVEHAQYVSHAAGESLRSINGNKETINNLPVSPVISEQQGINLAIRAVNAKKYEWEDSASVNFFRKNGPAGISLRPTTELLITKAYIDNVDTVCLAWKVNVKAREPNVEYDVYIDAIKGTVLKKISADHTTNTPGTVQTLYSGTQSITGDSYSSSYRLAEIRNGVSVSTKNINGYFNPDPLVISEFLDNDNNWTMVEHPGDVPAHDIHWAVEKCLDYWRTVHSRNSLNGLGMPVQSYAHWVKDLGQSYPNAAWRAGYASFFFGDGGLIPPGLWATPMVSSDIVYHEIGHGICAYTANLIYNGESGALNEGLSDIWGCVIEAYTSPGKQKYLLGEEVASPQLRSMINPKVSGSGAQPNTKGGTYWVNPVGCSPSESNDYCGVHTNSGVINYWFYLLTEGGSGTNDIGSTYSVNGIGLTQAAAIVYRTESLYLTSGSNFANFRDNFISAARDIYGMGSCQEIAATNAFYAVGIGAAYVPPVVNMSVTTICPSGTASLSFNPAALSSVAWSVTPTGIVTPTSGTGNTLALSRVGTTSGTATVTATINTTCAGLSFSRSRQVRAGIAADPGNLFRKENAGGACGWDIYVYLPLGAVDIQLSTNGGASYSTVAKTYNTGVSQYECKVGVNIEGPSTTSYLIRAINACGNTTGVTKSITVTRRSVGCAARMGAVAEEDAQPDAAGETAANKSVKVYPNPTSSTITIDLDFPGATTVNKNKPSLLKTIKVSDSNGFLIKTIPALQSKSKTQVDLSQFPAGAYFVEVMDGESKSVNKIILQR